MVLGLIPAKGGSQRLALKNIRSLGGRPLIEWAAKAAWESGVVDRLILSTEAEVVAESAVSSGIEVPFIRPKELAKDPYGVVDVALHAIESLEEQGDVYDRLVILLPTSPLRTANDIRQAYRKFNDEDAQFLMSVSEYAHTPFSALRLEEGRYLKAHFAEYLGKKSQQMPLAYRCNGAIHILDIEAFNRERSYYAEPLLSYIMPPERSVDIDTELDFRWAEFLYQMRIERV